MDRTKHYYHEAFYEGKWVVCADWDSREYDWRARKLANESGCKVRIWQCGRIVTTFKPDGAYREARGLDKVINPRKVRLPRF